MILETVVLYTQEPGEGTSGEPGMGLKFVRIVPGDRLFIQQYIRDEVMKGISSGKRNSALESTESDTT